MLARIATDAKPGEAHASESASEGTREAAAALEAPGEAGELSGRHDGRARRHGPAGPPEVRAAARALLAGRDADRGRARHRPLEQIEGTGRGGRVRKQDVLALRRGQRRRRRKSRRCTSRARTGRSPTRRSRLREAQAAPAPRRRPPDGAAGRSRSRACARRSARRWSQSLQTAATCTTIVEADMTRDRGAPQATRADVAALRRPRDDRDAARVPGAQRDARGRDAHAVRRASTSASRCRSARAA